MSRAAYRLISPDGQVEEDGDGDVEVSGATLILAPSAGAVLRVPFTQITSVTEAEPFGLRVGLADGTVIELTRMGAMRTQILAELREARSDAVSAASAAVGSAELFTAAGPDGPAEVRVHEDALLVIGPDHSERVSFAFVTGVVSVDYSVTVQAVGRPELTLSRLGRRTGEFADLLNTRLREARSRTSAFLAALLPGLAPMELRKAAGLLRDGVAAPAAALAAIHPELPGTLVEVAALADRVPAAAVLRERTDLAIGFKQVTSVRRAATGVSAWRDSAAPPRIGEHDSPGGSFAPGLAGMMAAGIVAGGPPMGGAGPGGSGFGGGSGMGAMVTPGMPFGFAEGFGDFGDYWAYRALGAGMNSHQARPMTGRADVRHGRLTPASEDLSALTVSGDDPSVLAFLLGRCGDLVVYEELNHPGGATYVYRAPGPEGPAVVNHALDDCGFAPAAVHAQGLRAAAAPDHAAARLLADSLAGQAPHGPHWQDRLSDLLAGRRDDL